MDAALAGTEAKAAETVNRQLKRIFCIAPPGVVGGEASEQRYAHQPIDSSLCLVLRMKRYDTSDDGLQQLAATFGSLSDSKLGLYLFGTWCCVCSLSIRKKPNWKRANW